MVFQQGFFRVNAALRRLLEAPARSIRRPAAGIVAVPAGSRASKTHPGEGARPASISGTRLRLSGEGEAGDQRVVRLATYTSSST